MMNLTMKMRRLLPLVGLCFMVVLVIQTVMAGNLREESQFRVLEAPTVVTRCLNKTLQAPKDPNAESRLPPPGYTMKSFETIVYIPIIFHICRKINATAGNVPMDSLLQGMDNLNEAYAGIPNINGTKFDTNVRFFLQGVIYWDNDDFFMSCEGLDGDMKAVTAVKQESVVNVYTCRLSALGFAYLPWTSLGLHGIILNFMSFPGNSNEDPYYYPYRDYNKAYTLVHEMGHMLGLLHTFEGGCAGSDAPDTAPEAQAYYGTCDPLRPNLVAPDTCPGGGLDPISNFMDYSTDACMRDFTPGQIDRMHTQLTKYKPAMAYMSASLTCYADGIQGPANKYGVCNDTFPLQSIMPNGQPAPENGWCYTRGFPQKWGTACCPGTCADFADVAPLFPPLGASKPSPTNSPTPGPSVIAVVDPRACTKTAPWKNAAAACRAKRMRLCTSVDIKAGVLTSALSAAPACASLAARILWTGLACTTTGAISVGGSGGRELCDRRTKKYPYVCCRDVPAGGR